MIRTSLFIQRPVMTTLVMLAILLAGTMGYRSLPINDLPNVDFPTLEVSASLPGASPDTMASAVATTLERQFSTISGLESMTSVSGKGSTQITLQFALDRGLDAAAQDVQAAISRVARSLPSDMPNPPSFRKVNPADRPILYMSLKSQVMPLSAVDEYAQTFIAQRISTVPGVAQVQVFGSRKYAVRIQLDPRELIARRIGLDEIAEAIRSGNVNLPTGDLQGAHKAFTVEATGQLQKAADYRELIVAWREGSPVRLDDLGDVLDDVENNREGSWYNGEPSVSLAVLRQPAANTVQIVEAIREQLPFIQEQIPPSLELTIYSDRSQSIRNSIHDVEFTFLLTICLVILVIFLFLRNLSATLIPAMALPMSIVGASAVMALLGYSLNNLTLMALTLCVGFVVDDAIVMVENIVRHMEKGKSPLEAALDGSREIMFTIVSMTLSLAAVFLPVLFMGGIMGRLLHEFAVTIGAAILVSGFVSLTLSPMMCSRLLRPPHEQKHGRVYLWSEGIFDGMRSLYDRTLRLVLRHRLSTLLASLVLLGITVWLFTVMPKGFLPSEDTGQIFAITEGAQGVSYEEMRTLQQEVDRIVREDPNVRTSLSRVGSGGSSQSSNAGRIFINLKPRSERKMHVEQVIAGLRPKLAQIPGIKVFLQNPPAIRVGGSLTKSQFQYALQSPDTESLYESARKFEAELARLPIFEDVTSDLLVSNPQIELEILRDKASSLGVSARQIEDALFTAYGSREVSTIYAPNNDYAVILELKPQYQMDPSVLSMLYIRSDKSELVPLGAVAKISAALGPLTVTHVGQLPAVTLSFDLKPGISLGDGVAAINDLARRHLPASISGSFQGTAQAFESSLRGMGFLLLMSVLVIYIVLGILYESFIHPITILSGLPSAGLGALLMLMAFKIDLSLYAFVGIVMLVGIVKKNAIMMIDFALDAQRTEGKSREDAIYEGCLVRFRPIMMTTMAALMGALPIALGYGEGSEARRPLGLAVVGGLIFSQALTLYLTPVYYIYLDRFSGWALRIWPKRRAAGSSPAAGPEAVPAK